MFFYNLYKKGNRKLIKQNQKPLKKEEAYQLLYTKENENEYLIKPCTNSKKLKINNLLEKSYNLKKLKEELVNYENPKLDRVVNTIIADYLNLSFIYEEDKDSYPNFKKGYIVDDYSYDEAYRPEGGSVVYYSQELFTESFTSIERILIKINNLIENHYNKTITKLAKEMKLFSFNKETIAKSYSYQIAILILTEYISENI